MYTVQEAITLAHKLSLVLSSTSIQQTDALNKVCYGNIGPLGEPLSLVATAVRRTPLISSYCR